MFIYLRNCTCTQLCWKIIFIYTCNVIYFENTCWRKNIFDIDTLLVWRIKLKYGLCTGKKINSSSHNISAKFIVIVTIVIIFEFFKSPFVLLKKSKRLKIRVNVTSVVTVAIESKLKKWKKKKHHQNGFRGLPPKILPVRKSATLWCIYICSCMHIFCRSYSEVATERCSFWKSLFSSIFEGNTPAILLKTKFF